MNNVLRNYSQRSPAHLALSSIVLIAGSCQ